MGGGGGGDGRWRRTGMHRGGGLEVEEKEDGRLRRRGMGRGSRGGGGWVERRGGTGGKRRRGMGSGGRRGWEARDGAWGSAQPHSRDSLRCNCQFFFKPDCINLQFPFQLKQTMLKHIRFSVSECKLNIASSWKAQLGLKKI